MISLFDIGNDRLVFLYLCPQIAFFRIVGLFIEPVLSTLDYILGPFDLFDDLTDRADQYLHRMLGQVEILYLLRDFQTCTRNLSLPTHSSPSFLALGIF